jgi:multidrug efflux pump subunit AcrB
VLSNPEELLLVNEPEAERYRISADDVRDAMQAVIEGTVATSIRWGDRLVDVRVRYPDAYHLDLAQLAKVSLQGPGGGLIPLSALVRQSYGGESPELARERLSPVVRVTARLSGVDLGTAVDAVKRRLAETALPAGVRIELGGLYAQQQDAFRGLAIVMLVGILGVLAVLLWEFGDPGASLAILLSSIACVAGGLAGLFVSHLTLNISSVMGLIMVVGIAAKNGILLFDQIQRSQHDSAPLARAVSDAVRIRIRPILMTALATIAGMMPLALGAGSGARIQQPLAIVVIGGLLSSILLSMPLTAGFCVLWPRGRTQ